MGIVRRAGSRVLHFDTIDSTNLQAKREADKGAEQGTLIVADMQTAGRGRRGREWHSPAGANAYFSLILKPDYEPEQASMVTLVMGLAVAETIREICGVEASIKWPNDIVINGKKVCGILAEMELDKIKIRHIIVGVGINVGQQEFAPEIAETATCLERECGERLSRSELIGLVMESFEKYYEIFCRDGNLAGLMEEYNRLLVNKERRVCVLEPKGEYRGTALGINQTGELLVQTGDEIKEVYAGEVSVRGIYGYV